MEDEGIISPVIAVECEYKTSTTFDDKIEISVEVEEFKGVRLILKYVMSNIETSEPVLIGKTKHCFLDKKNKPIILKKNFLEFTEKLEKLGTPHVL